MWVLYDLVNPLTAWLNLASWIGYGIVYTLFLKRATPQNIVIGGLFGAAPPLFGWAAVSNSVEPGALLLVLIIFAWTPPHFWALALDRKEEYRNASIPMLPVTHGEVYTRWHILFYTLILVAISLLPYLIGMSGLIYLASAAALGIGFLYWAVDVAAREESARADRDVPLLDPVSDGAVRCAAHRSLPTDRRAFRDAFRNQLRSVNGIPGNPA